MYYSEEMKLFMAKRYPVAPISDWLDEFNRHFNCNVSKGAMLGSLKRYGIKSGRTGHFVEGQAPHNKGKPHPLRGKAKETAFGGIRSNKSDDEKPIGSTRIDSKDGYLLVKTKLGTNSYELAHRIIWEKENGKIPSGYVVRFYDNSPKKIANPTIDNLFIVSRPVHARLNQMNWSSTPLDMRETKILIAKIEQQIMESES